MVSSTESKFFASGSAQYERTNTVLRYDYHNPAAIRRWGRYAESILDDDGLLDVILHDDRPLKLFASDKKDTHGRRRADVPGVLG